MLLQWPQWLNFLLWKGIYGLAQSPQNATMLTEHRHRTGSRQRAFRAKRYECKHPRKLFPTFNPLHLLTPDDLYTESNFS